MTAEVQAEVAKVSNGIGSNAEPLGYDAAKAFLQAGASKYDDANKSAFRFRKPNPDELIQNYLESIAPQLKSVRHMTADQRKTASAAFASGFNEQFLASATYKEFLDSLYDQLTGSVGKFAATFGLDLPQSESVMKSFLSAASAGFSAGSGRYFTEVAVKTFKI